MGQGKKKPYSAYEINDVITSEKCLFLFELLVIMWFKEILQEELHLWS